jgi:hypothetical protein
VNQVDLKDYVDQRLAAFEHELEVERGHRREERIAALEEFAANLRGRMAVLAILGTVFVAVITAAFTKLIAG